MRSHLPPARLPEADGLGSVTRVELPEMAMSFLDEWLDARADAKFNLGESGVSNLQLCSFIPHDKVAHLLAAVDFEHNDILGSEGLRHEIAKLYTEVSPSNILVTTGVSEAILIYFMSKRMPKANAVVVTPTFHSLYDVPAALGIEVRLVQTTFETGFRLPIAEIVDRLDENTRCVVLTSPGNPTGTVFDHSEILELAEQLRPLSCDVVMDEQYRLLPHDPKLALFPSRANIRKRIISLGSAGKCVGAVGLRIGWIAASDSVVADLKACKALTTHAVCKLNDLICTEILRSGSPVLETNRRFVRQNKSLFAKLILDNSNVLEWVEPSGGTICFPRLKQDTNSAEFAQRLYEETDVLVLPGEAFDMPGFFRMRLGIDTDDFAEAVARMSRFLKAYARQRSAVTAA